MALRIEKQLQRVARQLLHRETKTPARTPISLCPRSSRPRFDSVSTNVSVTGTPLAALGRTPTCCSPRSTEHPSNRATSTACGTAASPKLEYTALLSTTADAPADRSSPTSTSTPRRDGDPATRPVRRHHGDLHRGLGRIDEMTYCGQPSPVVLERSPRGDALPASGSPVAGVAELQLLLQYHRCPAHLGLIGFEGRGDI